MVGPVIAFRPARPPTPAGPPARSAVHFDWLNGSDRAPQLAALEHPDLGEAPLMREVADLEHDRKTQGSTRTTTIRSPSRIMNPRRLPPRLLRRIL
jgi:hypothetical protein